MPASDPVRHPDPTDNRLNRLSAAPPMTPRRRFLLGALGLAGAGVAMAAFRDLRPSGSGSMAPELIGGSNDWINTEGKALRLRGANGLLANGGVVLVDFWDYTCVNCVRTMPHLRAWNERYGPLGLTIVGIHTPEFEFAQKRENVAAAARRLHLTYPILNDAKYANWSAFQNRYWPRKYLIGSDGKIVYDHAGEGGYPETEEKIRAALLKANPKRTLPRATGLLSAEGATGPLTPELYAGNSRGTSQFGSPGGMKEGQVATYDDPGGHQDGYFYAKGQWKSLPESLRHARSTTDPMEDTIALRYRALEVNAVIRPETGAPFDLYLTQDGAPLDKADYGADVKATSDGQTFVHVDAPRMYQLVSNRRFGQHELKMGTTSPGMGLYSFAFSASRSLDNKPTAATGKPTPATGK